MFHKPENTKLTAVASKITSNVFLIFMENFILFTVKLKRTFTNETRNENSVLNKV